MDSQFSEMKVLMERHFSRSEVQWGAIEARLQRLETQDADSPEDRHPVDGREPILFEHIVEEYSHPYDSKRIVAPSREAADIHEVIQVSVGEEVGVVPQVRRSARLQKLLPEFGGYSPLALSKGRYSNWNPSPETEEQISKLVIPRQGNNNPPESEFAIQR